MNYFEHDVKVKFFDGILEHSCEWQWFINYIEKEFKGFKDITNFQDFLNSYAEIKDIYAYLIKLNSSIGGLKIEFTTTWLKQIYLCTQIYGGTRQINSVWQEFDNNFIKLFATIVHITKIQNIKESSQYIFSALIFMQNNIFELFNLSAVKDDEQLILQCLSEINITDIQDLIIRFKNNIKEVIIPANLKLLEEYKSKILNVNSFSFQRFRLPQDISWEEQFVFDMLQTEISENELIPLATFNGVSTPDISRWTLPILEKLNKYFNDETASFIIETVRFILYRKAPAAKTMEWHFKLVISDLKNKNELEPWYEIKSSSLLFISLLLKEKIVSPSIKNKFMQQFVGELSKFVNTNTILQFKKHNILISSQQKEKLDEYNNQIANNIINIERAHEFIDYCRNDFVVNGIRNETLKITYDKFTSFIEKEDNSASISMLFYYFMQLLLRLSSNLYIDKPRVKQLMIWLQQLWQNNYYDRCLKLMHTIGSSVSISNEEINKINKVFIEKTLLGALYCFPIKKESLLDLMSMHSETAVSLFCSKLDITRMFPVENNKVLDRHNVDNAFIQLVRDLITQKGYKLSNYIEPEVLYREIYNDFIRNTQMYMAIFNQEQTLYKEIQNRLSEYSLIDFDGRIYLAHLTQLFPILENKIREFGMYCNIVPFKEKTDEFLHMKDASSVLQQILMDAYSETNDFLNVVDFFFVYQSMYNGNCLNIRNECAHGREYISSNSLFFGFKTTLICLKLILDRIDQVKNIEKSFGNQNS